jgi:hypothetical protein
MPILKFVAHSHRVLRIARRFGWLPAARYTNLRDVRSYDRLGFLDVNWKDYKFKQHLRAAIDTKPLVTVARDVENIEHLPSILDEAFELLQHATHVVIVPKDMRLKDEIEQRIPPVFLLGYSVPTRYGGTKLPIAAFKRPVHLLGGRPDVQRKLAEQARIFSVDCNRFTLDAAYGDYFDGAAFRPHPRGGYERCIRDSLININRLWESY